MKKTNRENRKKTLHRRKKLPVFAACLLFSRPVMADDLAEGKAHLEKREYEAAFAAFKRSAGTGEPRTLSRMIRIYKNGEPGEKADSEKVRQWQEKAEKPWHGHLAAH